MKLNTNKRWRPEGRLGATTKCRFQAKLCYMPFSCCFLGHEIIARTFSVLTGKQKPSPTRNSLYAILSSIAKVMMTPHTQQTNSACPCERGIAHLGYTACCCGEKWTVNKTCSLTHYTRTRTVQRTHPMHHTTHPVPAETGY